MSLSAGPFSVADLLVVFAGLDGALLIILGVFYAYAALKGDSERPRIALFLGLMMGALGVAGVLVFYTGGLGLYLASGGRPVVGLIALVARVVAGILLLAIIINSLASWGREREAAKRDSKEKKR